MGSDDEKRSSSKTNNNKSSHRSNSHRSSNHRHTNSQPFEGSNPLMKGHYYTYNSEQQSVDQYQSTTEKLIEIVCSAYKEPALLKACLKSLNMQTILEPELQTSGKDKTTTKKDELKFNIQFKEHQLGGGPVNVLQKPPFCPNWVIGSFWVIASTPASTPSQ